jgi:hypothetical protein
MNQTVYTHRHLKSALKGISYIEVTKIVDSLVTPVQEFNSGKRTYRLYDQAAMDKVKAYAKEHAEKMAVKKLLAQSKKMVKAEKAPLVNDAVMDKLNELSRKLDELAEVVKNSVFTFETEQQ